MTNHTARVEELKKEIKENIEKRLVILNNEGEELDRNYASDMKVVRDSYYAASAKAEAAKRAGLAQGRIDAIIEKKMKYLRDLEELGPALDDYAPMGMEEGSAWLNPLDGSMYKVVSGHWLKIVDSKGRTQ